MTNMRPLQRSTLLKVVILGDGGIGKSCLMNRFVSNRYDENNFHTIGVEFMNKDIQVDGDEYTLQIWDTAGQERFRALRTPFYRGSDICMLCYAINDHDSYRSLRQWRNEFLTYADVDGGRFPFIVVGNKNDISPPHRQVSVDEVHQWCDENGIVSAIETSAKTATNVHEAFALAVREWKQLERATDMQMRQQHGGDTIDLTKTIRLHGSHYCCTGGAGAATSNADESDSDDKAASGTPRRWKRSHQQSRPMNFQL